MNFFRRISPTAIVALSIGAILFAAVLAVIGYVGGQLHQRALQDKFGELPGCAVRSQRWVRDSVLETLWLEDYEDSLPADGIHVAFNENATPALAQAQRLRNVYGVTLNNCALESYWPWILARTDLEYLGFEDVAITDLHLAQFVGHNHIDSLQIRNAPITDASLTTIAKLRIECLELQNTNVTLAGIDAFAAAQPHVRITWIAPLSDEVLRVQTVLAQRDIDIEPLYPQGIARDVAWRVTLSFDSKPTAEDLALLAKLPGRIEYVGICEPLDDELLQNIRDLPGVSLVRWFTRAHVYEGILILGESPTIKQFDFAFNAVTQEQMQTLRNKHPDKLVNFDFYGPNPISP